MKLYSVVAAVLGCLAPAIAWALPPDQIFDRVAPAVWSVKTYSADEKLLASASGIVVAPGKLVTSCQVLARARQVQLRSGNAIFDAKLEFPDVERDLCQLDVPGLTAPAPAVGSARGLRTGQRLYVIGYSLGNAPTIGEGIVSAVHDAGAANERIQTTVPAARGLLGAGVFDDEGRMVGVVTSSPKDAAATVFAVPAQWLAEIAARGQAALDKRAAVAAKPAAASGNLPAAGTTWVYGFSDRMFGRGQTDITVRALRVDGTAVEELVSTSDKNASGTRRVIDTSVPGFVSLALSGDNLVLELTPYLLASSGGKAPADLSTPGYPMGGPGLSPWVMKAAVADWEQINLPAGSFRALRIEVEGRRIQPPAGNIALPYVFKLRTWYAPQVQRIVRIEHQVWSGRIMTPYAHDVVELLKYTPPS
jgi:S1-C subfamily serine protease